MVDFTALNTFKNANLGNDNAIAKIDENKTLSSDSTFSKLKIFRFLRSSSTQTSNNQVRTELLKSLGKAFGLEQGIGTGPKGEVTFSKDFMDKLEAILGPSFKRSDFGVPAEGGAVKSGKPLTQRRISQIMTQAVAYENKDFSIGEYKNKLAVIMKALGMPDVTKMTRHEIYEKFGHNPVQSHFANVQLSLDYLEKELELALINDETMMAEYVQALEENVEQEQLDAFLRLPGRFKMKDPQTGNYVNYSHDFRNGFNEKILRPRLGGELLHTERSGFNHQNSESIEPLQKYIGNTLKSFVKNSIDTYLDCKRLGKMEVYNSHVANNLGACMEDKVVNYIEFRQQNLDEGVVDVQLENHLNNIVAGNEAQTQKQSIEAELELLMTQNPDGDWEHDYAPALKEKLVGKYSTVIVAKENEETGNVLDIIEDITPEAEIINDAAEHDDELEETEESDSKTDLEKLLSEMQPLAEDVTEDQPIVNNDVVPDESDDGENIDATLEKLATEFVQTQDKIASETKSSNRSKIGKLRNILPFKQSKHHDQGLGDLFGWAGVAANDDEFAVPGFFTTKSSKK